MSFDPALLPRDPDRLIAIIMDLQERNEHLQGVVAALQRAVFGPRSEKLPTDPAQLQLDLPDVVLSSTVLPANDDDPGRSERKRIPSERRRRATSVLCRSTCRAARW